MARREERVHCKRNQRAKSLEVIGVHHAAKHAGIGKHLWVPTKYLPHRARQMKSVAAWFNLLEENDPRGRKRRVIGLTGSFECLCLF